MPLHTLRKSINYCLLISTIFTSISVKSQAYKPKGLKKLNTEERMEYFVKKIFPSKEVEYKDNSGNQMLNIEELDATEIGFDYYIDSHSVIREIVVRNILPEDKKLRKQMINFLEERDWGAISPATINCENKIKILNQVYEDDQSNGRTNNHPIDRSTDKKNLEKILGVITTCGFPNSTTVGKKGVSAVFYVLQHGPSKYREQFFPLIRAAALRGDLQLKEVAMFEDRILMNNGEKQKYGTQLVQSKNEMKLYPVANMAGVDSLRKSVGLEPLKEFLNKLKSVN